jgi:hypothetical protein
MNTSGQQVAATAELIPEHTNETYALDQSEQEYNRMISQHMTYHRMMMDDLMKLSSESGSNPQSQELLNVVSGLGTTVGNIDTSNKRLLQTASKYVDQGKDQSNTVSKLNAYIKANSAKLKDDINAYDALMNKEGFANANPTMNAALEMSEIMNESQKYALVIFGSVSVYLLYKIVKHL